MVESIFGGKATYPLGCYERNVFQAPLVERRLSVQSTHLKTISETGDDSALVDGARDEPEVQTVSNEGPSSYRRPRTMSLPAIYRDGSYLRIRPAITAAVSCQKRRYSEPSLLATKQILHRLSPRSNDKSSFGDESENGFCKGPAAPSIDRGCTTRHESTRQDLSTPRRHSDPMCYVTDHVQKSGLSMEQGGKPRNKVLSPEVTVLSMQSQTPHSRIDDAGFGPRFLRRRKSSLVPVPFSSPIKDTQKPRNNQSFTRPVSFPPSKKETKRHCNLPSLNLKPRTGTFSTRKGSNEHGNQTTIDQDYNNNCQVEEQTCGNEEENKDLESKYAGNEDILVQWMKFFG